LRSSTGAPIAGVPIAFLTRSGAPLCFGTTNAAGTASCGFPLSLLGGVLSFGYQARFAGNATYDAASDTAGLIG
jgi:hypothetical protein